MTLTEAIEFGMPCVNLAQDAEWCEVALETMKKYQKLILDNVQLKPKGYWIPSVYKDKRTQKSIQKTHNGICVYRCSICKADGFGGKYCSNCGVKMESEVEK